MTLHSPLVSLLRSPLRGIFGDDLSIFERIAALNPLAWLRPDDLSGLFQDSAGTIPVTADGQPVGYARNYGSAAANFLQPTDAARPVYRMLNGYPWIQGNGVNQFLQIDFGEVIAQPNTISSSLLFNASGSAEKVYDGISGANRNNVNKTIGNVIGIFAGSALSGPTVTAARNYKTVSVFNGAQSNFNVDGVDYTGNAGTQGSSGLYLFCATGLTDFMNGRIYNNVFLPYLANAEQLATLAEYNDLVTPP